MKIIELSLYNFCVYRGQQNFELSPTRKYGKNRPVILVGGINGGGKTTLFDAILLVLYGSRANCSKKRRSQPYHDFLLACIHRGVDPSDGASVSLSFEYASEGEEHVYEVIRTWSEVNGKIRENLEVRKDGKRDGWLSKNWNQVVEEIIPIGISQLFFFDAEQIRFIAEDESTNEALGSAIKALLGLDLAERLIADAKVMEMKLREKQVSEDRSGAIEELKRKLAAAIEDLSALRQDRSSLQNSLDKCQNEFESAERAFERSGGKHWSRREDLKKEQAELLASRQANFTALEQLAFGSLPLTLVPELLSDVRDAADRESVEKQSELACSAIAEYKERVLRKLRNLVCESELLKSIEVVHDAESPQRVTQKTTGWQVDLSPRARVQVEQLLTSSANEVKRKASDLVELSDDIESKIELVKRSLAAAPKDEAIKDLSNALTEKAKTLGQLEQRAKVLNQAVEEKKRFCDDLQKELENLLLKFEADHVKSRDSNRMAELAARTQKTMQEFLQRSTASKIDQLAEHIFESFKFLHRKKSFVQGVRIDPQSFEITLLGTNGTTISKQRLSEGEKQIFAISVLWGLARASKRRLPAIIDTPMGRLDSAHRDNLLTRYFPNASHQTIVLSTDTEVDERYFELLEPNVSRAYLLAFDEERHETNVEEGYFWKQQLVESK